MKKYLSLAVVLAIAVSLVLPSAVLAADPTVVNVNWNGGGIVTGVVTNKNDSVVSFGVNAGLANGSFTATNSNDNPYGYNVDTNSSYI